MPREHSGGPVSMPADELAAFLSGEPTGAICVTDAEGRLLALPARVLGVEGDDMKVEVDGFPTLPAPGTQACVVADRFVTYEAIRGVIAQGEIASTEHSDPPKEAVTLAVSRTVSFSFANVIEP